MVRSRDPYDSSMASERRYSQQVFVPQQATSKACHQRYPSRLLTALPGNPLQCFDSILHKELVDNIYTPAKPASADIKVKLRDRLARRDSQSSIESARSSTFSYHAVLQSLRDTGSQTSIDSWVSDQKTDACVICRRAFKRENARSLCSSCVIPNNTSKIRDLWERESLTETASQRPSTVRWSGLTGQISLCRTDSSSLYQLPTVTIMISRSRVLVFPSLGYSCVVSRLAGLADVVPLFREHKPNNETANDGDAKSISSSLAPKRGSKIAKSTKSGASGQTGNSSSSGSTSTSAARKRTKKRQASKRFGCMHSKRDPCRYQRVIGSCTLPPGMELKYIVEHLDRVHSGKTACPWCGQKWSADESWIEKMHEHTTTFPCQDADEILSKPEVLSVSQQAALDAYRTERHNGPETKRWVELFMSLFPDEYPIPSPFYDFYTPTHLIRSPTSPSQQSSPPTLAIESNNVSHTSPMLVATTNLDDLDPSLEPPEFDEVAMSMTQIAPQISGAGWLNENEYPLTLNQITSADGHAVNVGGNIVHPTIMKPADGQDTMAFFDECINRFSYQT